MALYRIDGWDYWPNSSGAQGNADVIAAQEADGYYDGVTNGFTAPGRFGGLCYGHHGDLFDSSIGEAVGRRWTTETCVIGQALFAPPSSSSWSYGITDAFGGTGVQFWVQYDDIGIISLYRGGTSSSSSSGGEIKARTPAKTYHSNEWDFVEIKFLVDDTSGWVQVRVNTEVKIDYIGRTSNLMTRLLGAAAGWDSVQFGGSSQNSVRMDDRYILDNTGASNTDYLGNVRVNTQLTTAPGDVTQMSVFGAAANWDAVNEPLLTEVEYVYDATMGHRDLYTMNPNVTSQNILGVQVVGAHRQDDATQLKSNLLLKTGGTEYIGSDHYLAQTYHYYRDIWELNPGTGVGWTAAQLNALQAGQKVLLG